MRCSYQVDIWHKVAQHGNCYSERPQLVRHNVKHAQVEVLPDPGHSLAPFTRAPWGLGSGFSWTRPHAWRAHASTGGKQRFERQRQQGLDQHEDAENLEGSAETQRFFHLVQKDRQAYGEEAGPSRHHAIGQAQALPEVVPEDHQRGLEGEGGAATKQYPICEVAKDQGPVEQCKTT